LECRRNGDCDITVESRRRCSACRLKKCLNSGMKRDRLLTVLIKEFLKKLILIVFFLG
jgi:pregnane X receptor